MSSQGTPSTWDEIVAGVNGFVTAIAPLVPVAEVAFPGGAAAISIGEKIVQGVIAAEPTAVALYNQIVGGTPPTAAQLQAFEDGYEADYLTLKADIAKQLAALPPAS